MLDLFDVACVGSACVGRSACFTVDILAEQSVDQARLSAEVETVYANLCRFAEYALQIDVKRVVYEIQAEQRAFTVFDSVSSESYRKFDRPVFEIDVCSEVEFEERSAVVADCVLDDKSQR